MRLIILAAGQGLQLDGYNKVLIRDPKTGLTVLDTFLKHFEGAKVTVVVGYRSINVMSRYPKLHYVYNSNWAHTNNSYSLGLALTDEPCIVASSDLFIDEKTVQRLEAGPENCILTENRANRTLSSLNCSLGERGELLELYQGNPRKPTDPEAVGIYKISDKQMLRTWKRNCLQYTNLFAGQNLPLDPAGQSVFSLDVADGRVEEVNNPLDYINLLEKYGPNQL